MGETRKHGRQTELARRQFYIFIGGMKHLAYIFRSFFVYLVLCVATYLMLRIIVDYSVFKDNVGFLRFKQDYLDIPWWKTAFYIHVFSSIFALLAGFTQ